MGFELPRKTCRLCRTAPDPCTQRQARRGPVFCGREFAAHIKRGASVGTQPRRALNLSISAQHREEAPDKPTHIEVGFEGGDAVSIDGERLSPAALLERLNNLGGDNGIGRA